MSENNQKMARLSVRDAVALVLDSGSEDNDELDFGDSSDQEDSVNSSASGIDYDSGSDHHLESDTDMSDHADSDLGEVAGEAPEHGGGTDDSGSNDEPDDMPDGNAAIHQFPIPAPDTALPVPSPVH